MIALRVLVFIVGAVLVPIALISATRTFVLARAAPDPIVRATFLYVRKLFRLRIRFLKEYDDRDRVMALYAPASLLMLPMVWLTVVLFGYTAMYWALGMPSVRAAFTASGSSLLTLGFSPVEDFPETVLSFTEAAIGLVLIALFISYLPTMYAAFSRREAMVTRLELRAGSPPTGPEFLRRLKQLDMLDDTKQIWEQWEHWFVELEETHTSLAALPFFRSPQPQRSWVTAAGAVLDACVLSIAALERPREPQAELCARAGSVTLQHIAEYFRIEFNPYPTPDHPISVTRAEFDAACNRLAADGLRMREDGDRAWRDFSTLRAQYDTVLLALAALTMAPYAPWSSDRATGFIPGSRLTNTRDD
ncbi:MAG: hypothetical protein M3081_01390 [Gemmatimonadota bacterium]|nr:hypothetical protein [Gemmatimonadota bacterium]